MKINKIIAVSVIAIAVIVSIFLIIRKKGVRLDEYSEDVTTETDVSLYEIISNDNGSSYVRAGNIMVYIPENFENTSNKDVSYWNNTSGKEECISIAYDPENHYGYDELKDIYYESIDKNYMDVSMANINMDDKFFVRYIYTDGTYNYCTSLLTEQTFNQNGRHLICVTVMCKDNVTESATKIIGKSIYQEGE